MFVKSYVKGIATKSVRVADVPANATDSEIADVAMAGTGETRTSVFGYDVTRYRVSGVAIVNLYTD